MGYTHKDRYNMYPRKFDSNGSYRPGSQTNIYIPTKGSSKQSQDTLNRINVINQIKKYLKEGKTLEEATTVLASNEEIKKQFEYLSKIGIDLNTLFQNWYNSREKGRQRQGRDRW